MKDTLIKISALELELRSERLEILSHLREEKERAILLMMLENNVNSVRRIRALKESMLDSAIQKCEDTDSEDDDTEIDTWYDEIDLSK